MFPPCYILLTDQISLSDIRQYVYCNCLLTRLWQKKIWNKPDLFNQAVSIQDQKVKTKTWISWEWKELLRWNKKHFSSFLKGFQLAWNPQTWECVFNLCKTCFVISPFQASILCWCPLKAENMRFYYAFWAGGEIIGLICLGV